jgi:hypothetical protein
VVSALAASGPPSSAIADDGDPRPHRLHIELDPLPFALGGYGGQIGYRAAGLPGWRFALASFALDVPDLVTQLDDANDGFHLRVRPSVAVYVLHYPSRSRGGLALGGAARYLRLDYSHDDVSGARARLGELSIEAIAGFKWHPWRAGFYAQPWLGISRALASTDDATIGERDYEQLPVQLFATVNLGWELEL